MLALSGRQIYLCRLPTDMRKSFDGLAVMVSQQSMGMPSDGSIYIFINRKRTQMKCLTFESGGYCIFAKRLESGLFNARHGPGDSLRLTTTDFYALLDGIDFEVKRQRKRYNKR